MKTTERPYQEMMINSKYLGSIECELDEIESIIVDEEGYIECKEKSGYFVLYESGKYYGDSFMKENPSKDVLLNTDENSYNTVSTNDKSFEDNYFISYDIYAKTVRKVLSLYQDEILIKSPSFGNEKLRKSISDYLLRSRRIKV